MERILIMTTGGTIAKTYGSGKGIRHLHIGDIDDAYGVRRILGNMSLDASTHITYTPVTAKDSLDMRPDDRDLIAGLCNGAMSERIIITHGTDTMWDTARTISLRTQGNRGSTKTIVLTGALLPACVRDTDAEFNLGLALGACLFAPPGIYIAMNGVHVWDKCKKNDEFGIFEPIENMGA
ncbi:MAG: asparaginase [Parcubacteria group bacterium]|nr:asparaginase [Parcubacteria group bacterium]